MSQKALIVEEIGKPVVLIEKEIPAPRPGEVVVKIEVTSLNHHDQLGRDIGLFVRIPAILGNGIAGTVETVGSEVTSFKKGDRIFGQTDILGRGADGAGLQQYCVLDADVSAHIPASTTFEEAATIPVNAIASFMGIFHTTGLDIGFPKIKAKGLEKEKIVVVAGGSSCGQYAIQFSKLAGFGEIITTASLTNEKKLKDLGATYVIDRHDPDVVSRVRNIVGDDLIYVFDPINRGDAQSFPVSLLSNTKKGSYASLLSGEATEEVAKTKKAGFERKGVLGVSHKYRDIAVPFWEHIGGWIEDGTVRAQKYEVIDGLDAGKVNGLLDGYRDGTITTMSLVRPSKL